MSSSVLEPAVAWWSVARKRLTVSRVCSVLLRSVWSVASGECLHSLAGHAGAVYCVAFSRDGQALVSGAADKLLR